MGPYANLDGRAEIRLTAGTDPLDVLETEMALLQRALERLARRSEIHRDLDRASYLLARTLEATGPLSVTELASVLGLDATTVTRQVAAMERRALLQRQSDPNDGRVSVIALSSKGRRTMDAVQRTRRARIRELFADWPTRDQREFGHLLRRFNDAIRDTERRSPRDAGPRVDASARRHVT